MKAIKILCFFFAFVAFSLAHADSNSPICTVSATTTAPNQPITFTPAPPPSFYQYTNYNYKWVGEASTTSTGPIKMAFFLPGMYTISLRTTDGTGVEYGALCPTVTVLRNATSSSQSTVGVFYPYTFTSTSTIAQMPKEIEPIPAQCFSIAQNLSFGYYDDVKVPSTGVIYRLQGYLNGLGYLKVSPTGYFGPMTLAAVKAFQLDNDIEPTGFVGPITRAAIKRLSCG